MNLHYNPINQTVAENKSYPIFNASRVVRKNKVNGILSTVYLLQKCLLKLGFGYHDHTNTNAHNHIEIIS